MPGRGKSRHGFMESSGEICAKSRRLGVLSPLLPRGAISQSLEDADSGVGQSVLDDG